MKFDKFLAVTVRRRQGITFSGEVKTISSYNQIGKFDVLPQHVNFVSMITDKLILERPDGHKEEINVDQGIMIVEANKVEVFLGVGKI